MPLIVINEAPLQDAIQNLARQACLNIQIDPKAPLSTVDPKSNISVPIPVSFHWENLNAMQALQALLDNHGLQLVQNENQDFQRKEGAKADMGALAGEELPQFAVQLEEEQSHESMWDPMPLCVMAR